MSIKKLFKSHFPSVNYVTVKGRTCSFIEGRFLTDHPDEISELEQVVNSKSNPHIYIDENEKEVDTGLQERIAAAQRAATLQVLEEAALEKQQASGGSKEENKATPQAPSQTTGMSPASLLAVTSSAGLSSMASLSNSK